MHAERGQIHPRFDRETSPRNQPPLVVGFEIVHVGAGSVDIFADRVSSTVYEVIAKPLLANIAARRVVDFEAANVGM